ncbi:MAG: DNA polymerase I [Planctomycetes bacterium RBG_16_64_10]|nr:MAG: DNA polymerase I [Planctomycetes bacterium RBG_16_64_10]
MTSRLGEPVGAVFGFARDMVHLLEKKRPDCLWCAFDVPGPTFRHAIYDQYKANRAAMPDELATQLPKIRDLLDALGVPVLECAGYEADDVLATVARRCGERGDRCLLVTSDKDCRQLISDRVALYDVRKDEVFDAVSLQREWGIRPDQVVDFQALVGDPTDNVPGIPLIGPKHARALLELYGTLEGVLEHAHEVPGVKRRGNLQAGRALAQLSRRLVELDAHVPIEIDFDRGRLDRLDRARVAELFAEFGFRSLTERVAGLGGPVGTKATTWQTDYHLVDTTEKLAALVRQLSQQTCIALDTETTNPWPRWAEIVGYSFAWAEGVAYYIPVRAPAGQPCLDPHTVLAALRPVLEDPAVAKVGQNLKYDMVVLRGAGVRLAGLSFDTMVASYLLDAGARNHGLDELSRRYLQHTPTSISELIGTGQKQKRMDQVPVAEVAHYAAEDADLPFRLRPLLARRLRETALDGLFAQVEIPLLEVLAEMEFRGIRVDVRRLQELSRQYGRRITALEDEIHTLAGRRLNIASPRQLAEVLFTELGLPVVKRTKTGPSTDAAVLEQLAALHQLPAKVLEYRQYAKLKNTYVEALPAMVHPATGRVHASFHQAVAATGRLSSSDPNLQNIPVRSEAGREIRAAFLPGPAGWQLLAADYSQIELRVLAHLSGDAELGRAFRSSADIHTQVASELFGVPCGAVTGAMRRRAKAVNFGVIYGQSPFGLARALGINRDEAAQFIDRYFARYPKVEEFLATALEACRKKGYAETILGRRRAIRGIRAGVVRGLNLPERTAINTVIQGSAADLIKLAMIAIHRRLRRGELAAHMLLQIHDELIFEVPGEELDTLAQLVRTEMCGVLELAVPLSVDLKAGVNWAECEPW